MVEPILDPEYWNNRLKNAPDSNSHHAIYICKNTHWKDIEDWHRMLLKKHIKPTDSVFDAGCAYGRLLDMMPDDWTGDYFGIDLSPDFITAAKTSHPNRRFELGSLLDIKPVPVKYDWAVCISIRQMVIANLGYAVWFEMFYQLTKVCHRVLILEYSDTEPESVIEC